MEIRNDNIEKLTPKLNSFDDHFILDNKLAVSPLLENIDLLKGAEISWKQIEDFEFQKMDVEKTFDRLIRRV